MTASTLPRLDTREPDVDDLVAAALPYLAGAWGNEARDFLKAQGLSDDDIRALAARAALEA